MWDMFSSHTLKCNLVLVNAILVQRPICKPKQMHLKSSCFKEKHLVAFKEHVFSAHLIFKTV